MKAYRSTLAAAWLCLLSGALPGAARAAETKLVVWHAYRAEEKAAFEKAIAAYNAQRAAAGVKVTTLAVPWDAFPDKLSAAVPRGMGPDVFIYPQDRLGGWVEAGNTVEPLDFWLDDALRGRFLPGTLEALAYRGTTYGLPLNFKVITMIYNKRLVPTPPKTSTELVEVAKRLTDKSAGRFGLAYPYEDFYYHAALMNAFGGRVFDPGTKPVMNAPENVKALELLMHWIEQDQILPAEPTTALITSLFNAEKAAIVFSGPWFLREMASNVEYGLAPLPTLVESEGRPLRPWMTVEGAYIAGPSKNKEEAFELLKFLTDAAAATTLAIEGGQCPAHRAASADPRVVASPALRTFGEQVLAATPMPNIPEMSMIWSPATLAMKSVVKKTASPRSALDSAQKAVARDVAGLRKR